MIVRVDKQERKNSTVVACRCCVAKVTIEASSGNIREVARLSGYRPIVRDDTTFAWVCPGCLTRLVALVDALDSFLGRDDNIFWNGLRYLLKERVGPARGVG